MGQLRIDLTGQTYGSLRVIKQVESRGPSLVKQAICYLCKCACGNFKEIMAKNLRNGRSKTCGCINKCEPHGHSKTGTYFTWVAMRQRCNNPKATGYERYGGVGIKVDPRWDESFSAFLSDMGVKPPGTSLDRIDNFKNYSLKNCRWATPKQQANNRKNNRKEK